MKILLKQYKVYPWTNYNQCCFRGYFTHSGKVYRGIEAANHIINLLGNGEEKLDSILTDLDGVFSFIIENENSIIFGVDRLRGFPVFYTMNENDIVIGDDIDEIIHGIQNPSINKFAEKDLLSTCLFVLGDETLIEGVLQVRAGEVCIYNKQTKRLKKDQYFRTVHESFYDDNDISSIKQAFYDAYSKTGENMVRLLEGRTAVVPLSGGADSRMIVDMLKKQNYKNVVCFTYGKKDNYEAKISKQVASQYGYDWYFIEYNKDTMWQVSKSKEAEAYSNYAFMYCATPHFQDFYAVQELKKRGLIDSDSVFIPGHSGDIPNGNHIAGLYMNEYVSKEDCQKSMLKFCYNEHPMQFKERMTKYYPLPDSGTPQDYATIEEWMDTAERQSKFIVNSVRVYEYFGYEWLIPLWDKAQFDFWEHISLQWRYKRKLYYYIVNDRMPSTNDMTIKKHIESKMREMPVIHQIASRIRRVENWWRSPLLLERFFSPKDYFKACFVEKSTFDFNTLYSKMLIKNMKRAFK